VADLSKLKRIVDIEYNDITRDSSIYHDKLRVFIRDGSIVDIWFSKKIPGTGSLLISLGEKTNQWEDISP
jgi:hypothetical protein